MILNEHKLYKFINGSDQNTIAKSEDKIQLRDDEWLLDSFPNEDQAFEKKLNFSGKYSLEKHGKTIATSDS